MNRSLPDAGDSTDDEFDQTPQRGGGDMRPPNDSPWPWKPDTTPFTESELVVPTPESYKRLKAHLASAKSPVIPPLSTSSFEDILPESKIQFPSIGGLSDNNENEFSSIHSEDEQHSEKRHLRPTDIIRKKDASEGAADSLTYSGASRQESVLSLLSPFTKNPTSRKSRSALFASPSSIASPKLGGPLLSQTPDPSVANSINASERSITRNTHSVKSAISSRVLHANYGTTPSTGGSSSRVPDSEASSLLRRNYGTPTPTTSNSDCSSVPKWPPSSLYTKTESSQSKRSFITAPDYPQESPSTGASTLLERYETDDTAKTEKNIPLEFGQQNSNSPSSPNRSAAWSHQTSSYIFSDGTTPMPVLFSKDSLVERSAWSEKETSNSASFGKKGQLSTVGAEDVILTSHQDVDDLPDLSDHWKVLRERIDYMGFLDLSFKPVIDAFEKVKENVPRKKDTNRSVNEAEVSIMKTVHDMAVMATKMAERNAMKLNLNRDNYSLKDEIEKKKDENDRLRKTIEKMVSGEKEVTKLQEEKNSLQHLCRSLEGKAAQQKNEIIEGKRREKNLAHGKRSVEKDNLSLRSQLEKLAEKESRNQKRAKETYDQLMRTAAKGGNSAIPSTLIVGLLVDRDKRFETIEEDNRRLLYENTALLWQIEASQRDHENKGDLIRHLGIICRDPPEMQAQVSTTSVADLFAKKKLFESKENEIPRESRPKTQEADDETKRGAPEIPKADAAIQVVLSPVTERKPIESNEDGEADLKLRKANQNITLLQERVQDLQSRLFRFVGPGSTPRDIIRRDKMMHKLQLDSVKDFDSSLLARIVQDIAIEIGSGDPENLANEVSELHKMAKKTKELQLFVKEVFVSFGVDDNLPFTEATAEFFELLRSRKGPKTKKSIMVDLCLRMRVDHTKEELNNKSAEEIEKIASDRADHMARLVEQSLKSVQVLTEVMQMLKANSFREILPKLRIRL